MDWRIFTSELVFRFEGLEAVLRLPATEEILEKCRTQLHLRALPKQLEDLYRQSDGIDETLNGEKIGTLVWVVENVIQENIWHRQRMEVGKSRTDFGDLLMFADAGNGDLFAFVLSKEGTPPGEVIYVWNHEDDSITDVAPDLKTFLEGWVSGRISV
jgi:hypothetical protein